MNELCMQKLENNYDVKNCSYYVTVGLFDDVILSLLHLVSDQSLMSHVSITSYPTNIANDPKNSSKFSRSVLIKMLMRKNVVT